MRGRHGVTRVAFRRGWLVAGVTVVLALALPVLLAGACGQGGQAASGSPAASSSPAPKAEKAIGVFEYGPDPSTKAAYDGLIRGLAAQGYVQGENLRVDFRDCGGSEARIEAAARDFAAADLDAVVPLTTPCLVAAARYVTDTPVVFTSVYDPMAAGVAASPNEHPANLTGVYTPPPVSRTLDLIRECVPGVRVIGTAYNPKEANSSSAVRRMQRYCDALGLRLVRLRVRRTADVQAALEGFLGGRPQAAGPGDPQVLYVTGDNTVMGAFADVAAVCRADRVPLFINDTAFVERGAVAGVGPDFASAGRAGGRLLAQVLDGRDTATTPLQLDRATLLYVNETAADAVDMRLPQAAIDSAARILP